MRAVVYVPAGEPRVRWYHLRGKAQCRAFDYEYVGMVTSPAEAEAARTTGFAETVVADPVHANDLVTWLHVVHTRRGRAVAAWLGAMPLAWDAVKDHHVRSAVTAAAAGAGALVALPFLLAPDEDARLRVGPPPTPPGIVAPAPTELPLATPPAGGPAPTGPDAPPAGGGGEAPAPPAGPEPAEPPPARPPATIPPAEPVPTEPPEATPTPSPTVQPSSPPVAHCLLQLEVVGIALEVCLP